MAEERDAVAAAVYQRESRVQTPTVAAHAAHAARPRRRGNRITMLFAAAHESEDGTTRTRNHVRDPVAIRGSTDMPQTWRNRPD